MILIGDIGNTDTKFCLLNKNYKIIKKIVFPTNKISQSSLKKNFNFLFKNNFFIKKSLFCSVVPKKYLLIKSFVQNNLKSQCSGDYIFHIDADEIPHENLLGILPEMLEMNDVDLVWIPRVNTVEGIDPGYHLKQWGWVMNEKGWVNYPDYQARVFRNDKNIRWTRPLHEYITGSKTYAHLPPHEELSLYHPKTIEKQEKQNLFYNENFSREMNVRN